MAATCGRGAAADDDDDDDEERDGKVGAMSRFAAGCRPVLSFRGCV
jgi:hypothetical protein